MLVDGGYRRKSCFWDFVKHLERLDVVLSTHLGGDNILGLGAFAEKKAVAAAGGSGGIHPDLGLVFMNVPGSVGRTGHAVVKENRLLVLYQLLNYL